MGVLELTAFLGWLSIINIGVLFFCLLVVSLFSKYLMEIHQKLFDVKKADLPKIYLKHLAQYKTLIVFFNIVPYFALKIMLG